MSPARVDESDRRGWIIPVGGNEEKARDADILRRFVELRGAARARIAVIPTAPSRSDTGQRYDKRFGQLGATRADVLPFADRQDAERGGRLRTLDAATGIFLARGNQLRISSIVGGTPVVKAIRRRNARDVVVVGTSAGAAILSEHMIAFGDEAEIAATTPTERTAGEADGLARALAAAEPGDLIVVLPHLERDAVAAVLASR